MDLKAIKRDTVEVLKDDTPGLSLKKFRKRLGLNSDKTVKWGPIQRRWYLRYKVKTAPYVYQDKEKVLGDWSATTNEPDNHKYTLNGARAYAEEIVAEASKGNDTLAQTISPSRPMPLKDKLKDFFEHILFEMEGHPGVRLKWMEDRKRLTYFPERKVQAKEDTRKRKGKLIKGKPHNQSEPKYKDWEMSQNNPTKYPAVGRDTYWAYLGCYNNWIANSQVGYSKPGASKKKFKLMNLNYNQIPNKLWKDLHKEIMEASSKYRANDTLQMLRVFYNWCINNEDKYILSNPITDAMSVPKTGPRAKKIDGDGTWAKVLERDKKKSKEALSEVQINKLIAELEGGLIPEPNGPADRLRNRSLLFMQLRLLTGCRPDVGEDLTWDMLKTKAVDIEVISKGRSYNLNVAYAKPLIFDRIKELKSVEPDHPFVFASKAKSGELIGTKKVSKLWKTIRDKVGIDTNWDFYNLKHTSAQFIMDITGQDIKYCSKVLGISEEMILKNYLIGKGRQDNDNKMLSAWQNKLKLVVNNK